MLEKLSERISEIHKITKYIFKYGLLLCLILFAFISYEMNSADTLKEILIARKIAGVGFEILAEISIGAVLFDVCMKNK